MNLRLSDEEAEALRACAAREGRSMNDVARTAIVDYVWSRNERLQVAIAKVRDEDAELLRRLGM